MESTWAAIVTFLSAFTFAIISPGPNFILVTNTALGDSRRAGLFTAFGVATGSGLFALAGLVGLLLLVHSLPYFTLVMRFVGGGYLVWIGFDMLRNRHRNVDPKLTTDSAVGVSSLVSYRTGLFTNLSNPKAWAFYLSLFTLILSPTFPLWGKVFLNVSMFLISLAWYATVAFLISSQKFQPAFLRLQPVIQVVLGCLLVLLGLKVLVA